MTMIQRKALSWLIGVSILIGVNLTALPTVITAALAPGASLGQGLFTVAGMLFCLAVCVIRLRDYYRILEIHLTLAQQPAQTPPAD